MTLSALVVTGIVNNILNAIERIGNEPDVIIVKSRHFISVFCLFKIEIILTTTITIILLLDIFICFISRKFSMKHIKLK